MDTGAAGAELRRLRQARGLTQDQLATASGLSTRTVRNLESGRTARHRSQTVDLLAKALDVDAGRLGRLLGGRPPDRPTAAPPPALGALVGREPDLRRIEEAMARADVVVVAGPGGVGKTALSLEWAEKAGSRFPDGILFVDLHGFDWDGEPLTTADALRQLLLGLGERADALPESVDELVVRYRAVSAGRDCLVLLDNARSSEQVRPLLPAGRGSPTLVTSRRRLDGLVVGESAQLLPLEPLSRQDAIRLLEERGPAAAATGQLATLAEACGRLPLALVIVAAHLQRNSERVLASSWQLPGSAELDLLEVEDGDRGVRRVLATTVDSLPARARGVVCLLGLWPRAELDPYVAGALLAEPPAEAVRLLDSLADLHLVQERGPGRYALHDLVAAYLGERAAEIPADERAAALRRVYRYQLAVLERCAGILGPRRDPLRTDADHGVELPPLHSTEDVARYHAAGHVAMTAVIRQAQRTGAAPYAWQLAYAATPLFERRGPRAVWIETAERAVRLVPRDDPFRPRVLSHLALAHAMSGRLGLSRGYWSEAVELVPPDSETAATFLTNIANVDCEQGDWAVAMAGYERAREVRRSLGNPLALAYTLTNMGRLRAATGDLDRACLDLEESLRIGTAEGDGALTATCLLELGLVRSAAGDPAGALDLLRRAAQTARDNANDVLEAEALHRSGELLPAGSGEAAAHLRAAHRLYAGFGDPRAEQLAADHGAVLDLPAGRA